MSDEFIVHDEDEYAVDPIALLFALVQSLHDTVVVLIEDLGSKGLVDTDDYIVDEPVTIDDLLGEVEDDDRDPQEPRFYHDAA